MQSHAESMGDFSTLLVFSLRDLSWWLYFLTWFRLTR